MSQITVSAIITTYNYGRYVVDALRSVLEQTLPAMEIIVVDDGSTDDTSQRLAPYLDRIQYIRQANQGVDAARNAGLAVARGTFVNFFDADDLWHRQKLQRQLEFIGRHPDTRILATGVTIERADLRSDIPEFDSKELTTKVSVEQLVIRSRFVLSGVLIRRDCFATVGQYRPQICGAEDRDLWIRLAAKFEIVMIEMPLVYYRVHGQNLSAAAKRMDAVDHRMLSSVFKEVDALHGRALLRLKAFSYAATMSAFLYSAAGQQHMAILRIVESLLMWPLKYEKHDNRPPLYRLKMLMVFLLRATGLKAPHSQAAVEEGRYA